MKDPLARIPWPVVENLYAEFRKHITGDEHTTFVFIAIQDNKAIVYQKLNSVGDMTKSLYVLFHQFLLNLTKNSYEPKHLQDSIELAFEHAMEATSEDSRIEIVSQIDMGPWRKN